MTHVRSRTGREEVSEYLNDAYRASSNQYKAPASSRMWIHDSQRDKLKKLSSDARTPVIQFLRDRPNLRKTLTGDSPHLQEAFQLAVDAIGQANETEQWETLAEILMDACLANPAASHDLHEVLYGVVTPAGQWGFWGQGALKKLAAPISSIASFGMQAFRNNQPRDAKQASNRSFHSAHSDPDDFSIGTCRSDSDDALPQTYTSAASDDPLSPTAATCITSARAEPVSKQQDLPCEDQEHASSLPPGTAASSTPSLRPAASTSASESAGPSAAAQQPSGPSALTLQSGSPNTVIQAAVGGCGNKKQAPHKSSTRLESSESANLPGTQAPTANGTDTAKSGAASSSSASRSKPDTNSEQELPTGVSASRDGSQRLPSKPLRSKRSADAMADGEVGFPMPSRPRVSVALPGPERPQRYLRSDEVDAMMGPLPDPSKMSEKELAEYSVGLERRINNSLADENLPSQIKLFNDDGTMVAGATEMLAAWEAKYTEDVRRANAAYEAAQRQYLLLTNKDVKSAIPSRVDQLKSRTPGSLATPPTGQPPSLAAADARLIHGKTFAEIMAEANSVLEDSKRQNAMLEKLKPYSELGKVQEEREKLMQGLPDGALPSLEATKATFEKIQAERMAANSASGPRARAQEQLSALEASLSRVSPVMYENEAYKKALRACQEAYSVGLSSGGLLPQQTGLTGFSTSARYPESSPYLAEALKQDPALCAREAAKVKSLLDDWRAGKIPSLSDALRKQQGLDAASLDSTLLPRSLREAEASASTAFGQPLQALPTRPGQSLATVPNLALPLHQDPPDDLTDLHDPPPLGVLPVIPRSMTPVRPTMLPSKARVLSRPGRGAMPLPISVHPQSRPFGVTQSSLAIREAAQLRARDPTARQLRICKAHAPPRIERLPKLEDLLEGWEMPEQLTSAGIPASLLAQSASFPQHASTSTSAGVLGMDAAQAGTSAGHSINRAMFKPEAKPAATPQARAATTAASQADAALPTAHAPRPTLDQAPANAAQLARSAAQPPPVHVPLTGAAPAATLPADIARPAAVAHEGSAITSLATGLPATNTVAEDAAAATFAAAAVAEDAAAATSDDADDEASLAAELQHNKAIKQRPGQKQRKKLREMAELAKVEDGAKTVAEAEAIVVARAEAEAKAKEVAAEEAAKAEEEAAIEAEAQKIEDARVKAACEVMAKAAADRLKAEAAAAKAADELLASIDAEATEKAQAAAKKKAKEAAKAEKKKAREAALQLPTIPEDQPGPYNIGVVAAAPEAVVQDPAPSEAAIAKLKPKKKKAKQAPAPEQQPGLENVSQAVASNANGVADAQPVRQAGLPQAVVADPPALASSNHPPAAALGIRINVPNTVAGAGGIESSLENGLVNPPPEATFFTATTAPLAEAPTGLATGHHNTQHQLSPIAGVVNRQYLPGEMETLDDSAGGWTVVNGHQRHAELAAAHNAPADLVEHLFQADPALAGVRWGEQPMDDAEPAEGLEVEPEVEKIGLAALEGQFPLRRRGVRAGRRHKKRYSNRDASIRPPAPSDNSDDESDHTVRNRIAVGQLPTSPLARQPAPWGYPDAPASPVRSIGLPPGLPVGNAAWPEVASIAAEQNARQTRRANALQAAQAAEAAKREAVQRAHAAAETKKQADAMAGQQPAGEMWPALHTSGPASAGGVLPRDAAAAMAEQIVAENQSRDAAAALMAKPKPKARLRAAVRAVSASEAAAAAAATATAGLLRGTSTAPAKGPRKHQGTAGIAEGGSTSRQADAEGALHADVQSLQLKQPIAEHEPGVLHHTELVELLEAELDADYCCPLTLDEFEDPVRAADGRAYERSAIEKWLTTHDTSPMTNEPMPHRRLVPDPELKHRMLDLIAKLTALTGE